MVYIFDDRPFEPYRWPLRMILDGGYFANNLPQPRTTFNNAAEYYDHFRPLIFEEVRAALSSTLETLSETTRRRLYVDNVTDNKVTLYLPQSEDGDTPLPGDFLLFTREDVDDVEKIGDYFFGVIDNYNEEAERLRVSVYITKDRFGEEDLVEGTMINVATLHNIISSRRAISAITRREVPGFFRKITHSTARPSWDTFGKDGIAIRNPSMVEALEKVCTVVPINDAQRQAITKFICCKDVCLVNGPPGCGKTTTIANMILTELLGETDTKILQAAPTNVAVEVIATQVLNILPKFDIPISRCVLLGHKDRLNINGILGRIFLDNRIKRVSKGMTWLTEFYGVQRSLEKIICDFADPESVPNSLIEKVTQSDEFEETVKLLKTQSTELRCCTDILSSELGSELGPNECEILLNVQSILEGFLTYLDSLPVNFSTPHLHDVATDARSALKQCAQELKSKAAFLFDVTLMHSHDGLTALIMRGVRVIFCTVVVAGRRFITFRQDITTVIVDEASQLVEAENLIMLKNSCERLCLVADPKQLSAMVQSSLAREHGYELSMFERLINNGYTPCLLDVQYRMHPEISAWPVAQFYSGKLKNGPNTVVYDKPWYREDMLKPLLFIDCVDGHEERNETGSFSNLMEAEVVIAQLQLFKSFKNLENPMPSIGIITPYSAQVKLLEARTKPLAEFYRNISVKSVDGFQGSERDIIIFSATRSNREGNIGFLSDHRRLNVAITRPKFALWIIGNSQTLSKNGIWSALIDHCKARGAYVDLRQQQPFAPLIKRHTQVLPAQDFMQDPIRGAEDAFDAGLWKLQFTQKAKNDISVLDMRERKVVIDVFLYLTEGHRTKIPLNFADVGRHKKFVKVEMRHDICVIWTVFLDNTCTQIIKIWRVVRKQNLQEAVQRTAESIPRSFTDEILELCADDQVNYDSNLKRFIPRLCPRARGLRWNKYALTTMDSETATTSTNTAVESLATMKSFVVSSQVIKLFLQQDSLNFELPFEVSVEERELIDNQGNSFILGRSGTGKTSVLVFKLLKLQLSFLRSTIGMDEGRVQKQGSEDQDERPLRQILITASPKLCSAIRRYYLTMLPAVGLANQVNAPLQQSMSRPNDDLDDRGELTGIPDRLEGLNYPLFLTFRQFLFMLDGTLSAPFFAPKDSTDLFRVLSEDDDEDDDFFLDDSSDDVEESNKSEPESDSDSDVELPVTSSVRKYGKNNIFAEVTFDRFAKHYYPHFEQWIRKKFSPARLWTEIQSFIKGNISNLTRTSGFLELNEYVELSKSRSSTISAETREEIYKKIFRSYEKTKASRKEWDMGDATCYIYRQLSLHGYTGDRVDYCYIDEVQDLLQTQIALFNYISPAQGFVFAGDTAQTISTGVGFRFEDLRLLFYKVFRTNLQDIELRNLPIGVENRVPPIRHLTQNYRSNSGVLQLANSLVHILVHRFPTTIDKLSDEYSLTVGARPVFLRDSSLDQLLLQLFGSGQIGKAVDFGSEQAILVRNMETKVKLSKDLETAIVLTVNEAKGLEFEDCLILNFFTDSPAGNAWRVLYNDVPNNTTPCPEFDAQKHHLLATELKMLYVAVTRAKHQLWFFDESEAHRQPMLDYWLAHNLVQYVSTSDKNTLKSMAKKSTPEQWENRGNEFYNLKNYVDARKCFRIAGIDSKVKLCDGMILMEEGDRSEGIRDLQEAQKKYEAAAKVFDELGYHRRAADALTKAGAFKKAANLYSLCGEHILSAACYKRAKLFEQAAFEYVQAQNSSEALKMCIKGGKWNLGLWIMGVSKEGYEPTTAVKLERPSVSREIKLGYIRKAAQHFMKDTEKMHTYLAMLPEREDRRKFLERFNLHEELIKVEVRMGNFEYVAGNFRERGDLVKASEFFVKASEVESDRRDDNIIEALKTLMQWLRVYRPFDVNLSLDKVSFSTVVEQLDKLKNLAKPLPWNDKFGPLKAEARTLLVSTEIPSVRSSELDECVKFTGRAHNPRLSLYASQLLLLHHLEAIKNNPAPLTFELYKKLHYHLITIRNVVRNMVAALEDLARQGTITEWSKWAEEFMESFPHPMGLPTKRKVFVLTRNSNNDTVVSADDMDVQEVYFNAGRRLYPVLVKLALNLLEVAVKLRDKLQPCPKLFQDRTGNSCLHYNPICPKQHHNVDGAELTFQRYELQSMIMELLKILGNPRLESTLSGQPDPVTSVEKENDQVRNLLIPSDLSIHDVEQVVRFRNNSYVAEAVLEALESGIRRMDDDDVAKTMIYNSIVPNAGVQIPECDESNLRKYLTVQAFLYEQTARNASLPDPEALLNSCNLLTSAVFNISIDSDYKNLGKVQPYALLLMCEKLWIDLVFLNRMNKMSNYKVVILPRNLAGFYLLGREALMSSTLSISYANRSELRRRTMYMITQLADTLSTLLTEGHEFFAWIQFFKTPSELARRITIRFISLYLLVGLNYSRSPGIMQIIIPSLQRMDMLLDQTDDRFPKIAKDTFRWSNNMPYKFNEFVRSFRDNGDIFVVNAIRLFESIGNPVVVMKTHDWKVSRIVLDASFNRVVAVNTRENPTTFTLEQLFRNYYLTHKPSVPAPQQQIDPSPAAPEANTDHQPDDTTDMTIDKGEFITEVLNSSTKLKASDIRAHTTLSLHIVITCRILCKKAKANVIRRSQVINLKEQIEQEAAARMKLIEAPKTFNDLYLDRGTNVLLRLIRAVESIDFIRRVVQRPDIVVVWSEDAKDEENFEAIRVKKTDCSVIVMDENKADLIDHLGEFMDKLEETKKAVDYANPHHNRFDVAALQTSFETAGKLVRKTERFAKLKDSCKKADKAEGKDVDEKKDAQPPTDSANGHGRKKSRSKKK